ncbi:MAG: hypothetical protein IJE49_02735 [Agathobacter sp.]|nr:hypothetical protein [Agathobacter sp.]
MGFWDIEKLERIEKKLFDLFPPRDTQNIHILQEGEQPQARILPAEYVLKEEAYAGELKEYAFDGELLNAIWNIMKDMSYGNPDLQTYLINECDKYLIQNGLYSDGGTNEWLKRLNKYTKNWSPEAQLIRFHRIADIADIECIKSTIERLNVHESDVAFILMLHMQWACPTWPADCFMGGSKSGWRELSGRTLYAWWERNGERMLDSNVSDIKMF